MSHVGCVRERRSMVASATSVACTFSMVSRFVFAIDRHTRTHTHAVMHGMMNEQTCVRWMVAYAYMPTIAVIRKYWIQFQSMFDDGSEEKKRVNIETQNRMQKPVLALPFRLCSFRDFVWRYERGVVGHLFAAAHMRHTLHRQKPKTNMSHVTHRKIFKSPLFPHHQKAKFHTHFFSRLLAKRVLIK